MAIFTSLIVAGHLMLAAADATEISDEVIAAKAKIQTAYQTNDVEAVRALSTTNLVVIVPRFQNFTLEDQLKDTPDLKIKSYKMEHQRVTPLTDTVAQLTFHLEIKGSFKGKPLTSPVRVLETWVKQDGKWRQASYQETALDEADDK